ncbi:alpha/beta hydrolase [Shouchella shacheensis]|uniref:alpha/beta hydrolase n=1 Tax=Shouchella shacheensis TaxID=1649580 RepID=UPI0007405438|nr:alpha/beta hydrolase [Shouchella shacheensis]
MTMNQRMKEVLEQLPLMTDDLTNLSPQLMREGMDEAAERMPAVEEVADVSDRTMDLSGRTINLRIYKPEKTEPLPAIVFYHGGGFVAGSIQSHDPVCRVLANRTGAAVLSVDYRLAPESPFPAAVEDAYEALKWVAEHAGSLGIKKEKIALAGDSAGGNLAAVTALQARDREGPNVCYQLLIYPSVGFLERHPASMTENAEAPLLPAKLSGWFQEQYIQNKEALNDPLYRPMIAEDLTQLPGTHIVTAQYDPLRDSGRDYAKRLEEAGVPVTYKLEEDMPHGFVNYYALVPRANEAFEEMCGHLKDALYGDQ